MRLHYNSCMPGKVRVSGKSLWGLLVATIKKYAEDGCGTWAAALSYYSLLSIFPLLLFLIYLGSDVLAAESTRARLNLLLNESLPVGVDNISRVLTQTIELRESIGLIGAVGLLWSASAVFAVLESALNHIWGGRSRPFWGRRLVASASILALSLFFMASVMLGSTASLVLSTLSLPALDKWGSGLLTFLLLVLLTYLLYRTFPSRHVPPVPALAGAIFVSLTLVVARAFFDVYLSSAFTNYGAVYGSLAWIISLALWTYVVSVLFLLGAEFGAALARSGLLDLGEEAA